MRISKKQGSREKILNSDKLLPFIKDISEDLIDEINEVSISTYNDMFTLNNPLIIRGFWEKGLNRKLSSVFINLLKNDDAYVALHNNGYIILNLDIDNNIIIEILDFFINDYNFERTERDNNVREYTFYYRIFDKSAEDNKTLIKGRFDFDVSIMYIDPEYYKAITEEEVESKEDCYEISYNIDNKIFFNRYITEDYNDNDEEDVINREVMLLKAIFADMDNDKITNIMYSEPV